MVLLAFSFVLGGASRQHELRLAFVELAALPLLVFAILRLTRSPGPRPDRLALGLLCAVCALPLLQLIPLPPGLWTLLPGRDPLALAFQVTGMTPGWLPLSLTPDRTWRSFLALVPPVAMFLGVIALRPESNVRLIQLMLAGVAVSILLGMAQFLSSGEALYPWRTTDAGNLTGFFANRNHLATLCLASLPFAAVLGASASQRGDQRGQLIVWLMGLLVVLVIFAVIAIRSRTGVILLGPVLAASAFAGWIASGRGRPKPLLLAAVGAAGLALVVGAIFAVNPLIERFDAAGAREGRFENWPIIADAANTYLPLGSGIGSFDRVFRSVEPLDRLDPTFFNQAHNDYLETWLETGWFGVALLALFLVWFARRSLTAWRARPSPVRDIQRAATIAIGVILLHSAVDYPLRTATLATLFALFCGVLELARYSWSRESQPSAF